MRFPGDVGANDGRNFVNGSHRDMDAANLAGLAVEQRKHSVLVCSASALLRNAFDAANVGFVNFDRADSFPVAALAGLVRARLALPQLAKTDWLAFAAAVRT